jgi:hypothetical protein
MKKISFGGHEFDEEEWLLGVISSQLTPEQHSNINKILERIILTKVWEAKDMQDRGQDSMDIWPSYLVDYLIENKYYPQTSKDKLSGYFDRLVLHERELFSQRQR